MGQTGFAPVYPIIPHILVSFLYDVKIQAVPAGTACLQNSAFLQTYTCLNASAGARGAFSKIPSGGFGAGPQCPSLHCPLFYGRPYICDRLRQVGLPERHPPKIRSSLTSSTLHLGTKSWRLTSKLRENDLRSLMRNAIDFLFILTLHHHAQVGFGTGTDAPQCGRGRPARFSRCQWASRTAGLV